jgi:hypothetical protein
MPSLCDICCLAFVMNPILDVHLRLACLLVLVTINHIIVFTLGGLHTGIRDKSTREV